MCANVCHDLNMFVGGSSGPIPVGVPGRLCHPFVTPHANFPTWGPPGYAIDPRSGYTFNDITAYCGPYATPWQATGCSSSDRLVPGLHPALRLALPDRISLGPDVELLQLHLRAHDDLHLPGLLRPVVPSVRPRRPATARSCRNAPSAKQRGAPASMGRLFLCRTKLGQAVQLTQRRPAAARCRAYSASAGARRSGRL